MNRSLERLRSMLLQEPQQLVKNENIKLCGGKKALNLSDYSNFPQTFSVSSVLVRYVPGRTDMQQIFPLLKVLCVLHQQTPFTHIDVFTQGGTQRRVEKAEILEHTVHFLQSTAKGDKARAEGGDGSQKHSFQDGISTCLQRATQFLGPEGKGLWLGAALDASFAARFSRSDSDSAGLQRRTEAHPSSSSLLLRKSSRSILQLLIHRSGHRLCTPALTVATCVQNRGESHKVASKQSPSQSQPVSQSLWRPWP